jgi:hypothetical protein
MAQSGPAYTLRTGATSDAGAGPFSQGFTLGSTGLALDQSARPIHDNGWAAAMDREDWLRRYLETAPQAGRLSSDVASQALAELSALQSDRFYGRLNSREANTRLKALAHRLGLSLEYARAIP